MTNFTRSAVVCFLVLALAAVASPQAARPADTKAKVTATDDNGDLTLKRDEQIALMFVVAMSSIEGDCRRHAGHACALDEMIARPKSTDSWIIDKLKFDPNKSDPNYEYKVVVSGPKKWEIWANPKKPGLGGFYFSGGGFSADKYYNPAGTATATSTKFDGYMIDGDSFTEQ